MKFIANSKEILNALNTTSRAIASNNVIPVLSHFHFKSDKDILTVTANNLQTSISTKIKVEIKGSVNICIPSQRLLGVLKDLPNQSVTFEFEEGKLTIKSGSGKYSMPTEDGEEFPTFPKLNTEPIKLESEKLISLIDKVLFAVADNDMKMSLTGVFLEVSDGFIHCTGCDGNGLSTIKSEIELSKNIAVIIPEKTLQILLAAGFRNEMSISISEKNICFSSGETEITSTLIDEKYPDYRAVIPQSNDKELSVDNKLFLGAAKRVSQFGNKATNQIVLSLTKNALTISAENVDFGEDANEVLPCSYNGEDLIISLSAKQLSSCFSKIGLGDVRMTFSEGFRAALIYGEENHLMLAMPYKII